MPTLVSAQDMPDQTGRTAIVTGASSGIGRAAAAALADRGTRVILAVRDQVKGRAAADTMGARAEVRHLDLASLASVREFAEGIDGPVDYLINNAGAMSPALQRTADGFESQFGVNHLGHFALTNLLLDRIAARVVTVSSSSHRSAQIDLDDLRWERRPYRPWDAYGQSKLANLLFAVELQRRLSAVGSPVLSAAADPGWASTGFRMTTGNRLLDAVSAIGTRMAAQRPVAGALPTLLATVGDVPGASFAMPRYFGVRGPATLKEPAERAKDADLARRLWEVSEELTATRFPLTQPQTQR